MLEASIYIVLKETVSDPQGLTIKHALNSLNYKEVEDVRFGKFILVKLNLKNKKLAQKRIDEMCKELLANQIIEEYSFKISEATT